MGMYEDIQFEKELIKECPQDYLFDINKERVIDDCMYLPFPGTLKWEANNPIWECNIVNKKSPKEAWSNYELMYKAVSNLYYITNKSIIENKYEKFVNRIYHVFEQAYSNNNNFLPLCREVLLRFTVAKIAPKVTALMPSTFEKIINESGIDISNGVYCPMAGFGGIIEGTKRVFKKAKKESIIEAYDINKNFCDYYGWTQRNILSQKIITDKIVIACPPFGNKTERWKGTPDNMYYDFRDWCKLIKEYIKASNYILIGPEKKNYKPNQKCGLFSKKYGIEWYMEYSNN